MREPFEIIAALGLPRPQGVLQVGANSGQEIPYFVHHGVTHAAMIEPLDGPFAMLAQNCAGLSDYMPVQALCASVDGREIEFHVASNNGESSSIFKPANHLADYPWVQFPATVKLQSFTLDRVYNAIAAQRPDIAAAFDLLFMDVQGAELEVLKGASHVLNQVNYIYTEVGIGGGYEGDVELIDLMHYLRAFDFRLFELGMNAEGWGNALFIKKPAR